MTRREPSEAWTIAAAVVWPAVVVGLAGLPVLRPWAWLLGLSVPVVAGAPHAVLAWLGWRADRRTARLQAWPRGAPPGVCRICGMTDPDWVDWGAHPTCREWLETAVSRRRVGSRWPCRAAPGSSCGR